MWRAPCDLLGPITQNAAGPPGNILVQEAGGRRLAGSATMQLLLNLCLFVLALGAGARARGEKGEEVEELKGKCTLKASGGDDAPQFLKAVHSCSEVIIPKSATLNIATRLNMTGVSNKHIRVKGTIRFNPDIPYWSNNAFPFAYQTQITFWILGGENIRIDGGGTIDGAGQPWYNAFATNKTLARPIMLTIFGAKHVVIEDLKMINSPEWFHFVNNAQDVTYNKLNISAVNALGTEAKNTDGWDIYRSSDGEPLSIVAIFRSPSIPVTIKNSIINNGDDCVSLKPNVTNVLVSNLKCNGSHGISIGSLGQYPGVFDFIENFVATDVVMSNGQNGARIKAFAGPNVGSGIVRNITFNHFSESLVNNPVVVDQCYMTNATACAAFPSNVLIQDVWFNNISGTGSGSLVAKIACSPGSRCSDINVNNFTLSAAPGQGSAVYQCQNTHLNGNAAGLFPTCTVT
ncbi:unnamed protein product [Mycena citricolor]|uniref:galacturonan 1,4-alpha-galacturonidase n=1 Tax=Mycena citricolor TaxID=2018698 RepID=A0AAD2JY07_9AGAR|nr:unnamed protein product [Mycena citricolor]